MNRDVLSIVFFFFQDNINLFRYYFQQKKIDVIEFYREKVNGFREELLSKLKEEQDEKLMDKMERDVITYYLL